MFSDFLKYIEENNLITEDDRVLLAVSGGIDSMVMAHLFTRTDYSTGIAHCNFSLRGKESDKDEELVKAFAGKNRIPFFSKRFDTRSYAEKKGISIQMAARDLRYRWFEELMDKKGYSVTAVAHNLNDNIETLLINLIRGTGITGLTGMKPCGERIIRPLLFAKREMITRYCKSNRITYREDGSNSETKYTRNKIRHLVIPVLREINPSIENTLQKTSERLRGTDNIITLFISELKEKIISERNGTVILRINKLSPYIMNNAVLYELTEEFGMTAPLLNDLKNIISGEPGGMIFTGTHRIIKNRNELIVTPLSYPSAEPLTFRNLTELRKAPFFRSVISVNITLNFRVPADKATACIDFSKLRFPLVIRKWNNGDVFYPFGMKHRKKLSDYFTDRKFSLPDKERVLLLEAGGKIVWIIGERIDDRFRVTQGTKRALIIKAQPLLR